jgi:cobalt-zinc-cadmium efflux system outer membrane protein
MKTFVCLGVAFLVALLAESYGVAGSSQGTTVSLDDAFARALEYSPQLKAAAERIGVAEAQVRQARLIPNPELEWEGEETTGSRPLISESEHTLLLSQTLELGGKRSART